MNIIKPKRLNKGDTIGVISPAGSINDSEGAELAKSFFENKGYNVVFGEHAFNKKGYLAGSDEDRLEDLHHFFEDKSIDGIFCMRGGYGSIRLINKIDYKLIRKNPKFFAGYSDITALCLMIYRNSGLITYHAPMFCSDFGVEKPSMYTFNKLSSALTQSGSEEIKAKNVYISGLTQGISWGGNLSTVVSLCGEDFIPDEKFVFFTEDLNEPVYKIDKMFTQLLNINKFRQNIQGLILGDFWKVDNKEYLENLFKDISKELNVPTVEVTKITHKKDKLSIPIGTNIHIEQNYIRFDY